MFEMFLKIHLLLAMIAMGSLIWHLLPGKFVKVLFPTIALILWGSNTLFQLCFSSRAQQAFITKLYSGTNLQQVSATKLELVLGRPITIKPGQYLYLRFLSDLQFRDRFQAHPFMITWWDEPAPIEGEGASITPPPTKSS